MYVKEDLIIPHVSIHPPLLNLPDLLLLIALLHIVLTKRPWTNGVYLALHILRLYRQQSKRKIGPALQL